VEKKIGKEGAVKKRDDPRAGEQQPPGMIVTQMDDQGAAIATIAHLED